MSVRAKHLATPATHQGVPSLVRSHRSQLARGPGLLDTADDSWRGGRPLLSRVEGVGPPVDLRVATVEGEEGPLACISIRPCGHAEEPEQAGGWALSSGRDGVAREHAFATLDWTDRIRSGIEDGGLVAHFQPILDLAERRISHYELLTRLRTDEGRLLQPGAAPRGQCLGAHGQLRRPVREPAPAARAAPRGAGATDDRGDRDRDDGLGHLKHLPVSQVKIDGEFIRGIGRSGSDRLFATTLVELAQSLGLSTVAEFVGDAETLEAVRELGIDYAQGFHIGRPGPISPSQTDRARPLSLATR